jgi:hypothetical protein
MSGAEMTRAERIARLNDLARRAMGIACVVVATEAMLSTITFAVSGRSVAASAQNYGQFDS